MAFCPLLHRRHVGPGEPSEVLIDTVVALEVHREEIVLATTRYAVARPHPLIKVVEAVGSARRVVTGDAGSADLGVQTVEALRVHSCEITGSHSIGTPTDMIRFVDRKKVCGISDLCSVSEGRAFGISVGPEMLALKLGHIFDAIGDLGLARVGVYVGAPVVGPRDALEHLSGGGKAGFAKGDAFLGSSRLLLTAMAMDRRRVGNGSRCREG